VLCPGGVQTNIFKHAVEQRPAGGADMQTIRLSADLERMMKPEDVGILVRKAIEDGEFYIFTHPEFVSAVKMRYERILDAFERAGERKSSALA
jgi:hypothetical protein